MKRTPLLLLLALAGIALLLIAAAPPSGNFVWKNFWTTNANPRLIGAGGTTISSNPVTGAYTITSSSSGGGDQVWTNDGLLIHPIQGPTNDIAFERTNGTIFVGTNSADLWGLGTGSTLVNYRNAARGEGRTRIFLKTFHDNDIYGFTDIDVNTNFITWQLGINTLLGNYGLSYVVDPDTGPSISLNLGAEKTRLFPGALNDGTVPYIFDTSLAKTSGNLFELKNNGTTKFLVDYNGLIEAGDALFSGTIASKFGNWYITANGEASFSANLLAIGLDGDLDKIKGVPYSWPSANAVGFFYNDGVGNLSWSALPFTNLNSAPATPIGRVALTNGANNVKTLSPGSNVTLTDQGTNIVIASSGGSGGSSGITASTNAFQGTVGSGSNIVFLVSSNLVVRGTNTTANGGTNSVEHDTIQPITTTASPAFANENIAGALNAQTIRSTNSASLNGTATTTPLTITGAASATTDLLAILSNTVTRARFDSNGWLVIYTANTNAAPQDGITLANTNGTGAGVQAYSPDITWIGNGWKTTATASNMPVAFRAYVQPVQGAAAPTANWLLDSSINNAAFGTRFSVTSAGALSASTAGSTLTLGSPNSGLSAATISESGTTLFGLVSENTTASSSTQGSFVGLYSNDGAAMASGDRLGGFLFGGSSASSVIQNSAAVIAYAEGTWVASSDYRTMLSFETVSPSATARTEKFRIKSNGDVLATNILNGGWQQNVGAETNKSTVAFELGTTNSIIITDTNGSSKTRLYTQSGTLYSSASPAQRTISDDEWSVLSGKTITTNIDGTAIGNTTLYTVPEGRQLIVSRVIIIPTTVTGLVTPSTVSVGKTASSYIDVVAAAALTGLTAVNTSIMLSPITGATVLQAGDALTLRISVGAVGTAYTFKAIVIGVLL